ncbi:hypothetical protein CPB83DRAFT_911338 [Crepidotus variabilis]|uniref:Uncharacterized protein n=1 Tax=Crepidotus variabilis TaxID=179855 RepID=A0A9P6E4I5_9AGAR|nr:hypothetical protein CPB83DRAFT_911338 [Crepidotus variabilis]
MVVNRKQPVAPAPPVSRSSSSQAVPTKKQTKISNASVESKSTVSNGNASKSSKSKVQDASNKSRAKAKAKARKSRSLIDRIFLLVLTSFTLYTFYACRPNPLFSGQSPYSVEPALCRSMATYRKHILEPYILPPLRHTLTLTQRISEPYISEARIHLEPYLKPVHQTVDAVSPHVKATIKTTKKVWKDTLVPLYTGTLKPYYDTAILPRYRRYIKPRLVPLQAKVEQYIAYYIFNPIRTKTNLVLLHLHHFYVSNLEPYVRATKPHLQRAWTSTTTLASQAFHGYQTHLHPWLLKTWVQVRPHLYVLWKQAKIVVIHVLEITGKTLRKATQETGVYRRQYVDPHLLRIWDKVVDPKEEASSPSGRVTPDAKETRVRLEDDLRDTTEGGLTVTAVPEPTSLVGSTSISSWSSIIATPSRAEPEVATPEVTPVVQETTLIPAPVSSATHIPVAPKIGAYDDSSTLTSSESHVDHGTSVVKSSVESTVAADIVETETTSVDSPPSTIAPSETVPPVADSRETAASVELPKEAETIPRTTLLSEPIADSDGDLDDFLNELGVGQGPSQAPVVEESDEDFLEDAAPPQPTLTEEERLAKVAEKRAEIVGRHENWFTKIHAKIAEGSGELVKTLQNMRDEAAAEVRRLGSDRAAKAAGKEATQDPKFLYNVQQDGERLIKGLEGYLKKAEGRSVDWKLESGAVPDADIDRIKEYLIKREKDKFDDLSQKVESKFTEKVNGMKTAVHNWYVALKDREAQIVLGVAAQVHAISTKAQEDLSMDYAWLDDVTYYDWQNYHDLMRLSDKFQETVRMIANGTSTDPPSPTDPVVAALDGLDKELGDVISGFTLSLTKVLAHGVAIYSTRPMSDAGEDGFFSIKDGQRRMDDLRGVDLGKVELKKDTVGSIPLKGGAVEDKKQIASKSPDLIGTMPIPPPPVETLVDDAAADASKVVIGKDKLQVEQSLKDIPLEPPVVLHEEL